MRVIFMGTPDFAVGTLEEIIKAGHEVSLVVTQPDKPKGRHGALAFPPVKECALKHGIEVFQPRRIRLEENMELLASKQPDMIVVAAFGQILPKWLLDLPKYGCINVHASLLPKYRGAAPIQWAVLNGEKEAGVTIMRMDVGLDTGDMITQRSIPLAEDETGGSLFDKLADLGAKLCVETMDLIESGQAVYTPQDPELATHVGMISKEMGQIDWTRPAAEIECQVRGLNPWPSAYCSLNGKTFKIWRAKVLDAASDAACGTIVKADKSGLLVQTGQGQLSLLEVQLEGKKRMEIRAFLNGYPVSEGSVLS